MKTFERLRTLLSTGSFVTTRVFVAVAAVVVVLDQITKYHVISRLTRAFEVTGGGEMGFGERLWCFLSCRHPARVTDWDRGYAVFESWWHFRYVENPGAAWGFLSGSASWFRVPFFLLVAAAAMVFIVIYFRKTGLDQWLLRLALALVLGGAMGNFLDRVRLGYVIDFIDWHAELFGAVRTWPTFNIADAAISVGVALLILEMIVNRSREGASGKATAKAKKEA